MDHVNTSKQSLLDKLKPSSKNKIINKKFKVLTDEAEQGCSVTDIDLNFALQPSVVLNEKNVDASFISVNIEEINDIIGNVTFNYRQRAEEFNQRKCLSSFRVSFYPPFHIRNF
jgi:hypothetical protein